MIKHVTFVGGFNDNGLLQKISHFSIIEVDLGNGQRIANIYQLSDIAPLPSITEFNVKDGVEGQATENAISALKSHTQLSKMKFIE